MMTLLLLLALVLLLVYAGWLWTAPRVPGVRDAGLVELLMSLAAGVLVGVHARRNTSRVAAEAGQHPPVYNIAVAPSVERDCLKWR